jgi:hypothetical protein
MLTVKRLYQPTKLYITTPSPQNAKSYGKIYPKPLRTCSNELVATLSQDRVDFLSSPRMRLRLGLARVVEGEAVEDLAELEGGVCV